MRWKRRRGYEDLFFSLPFFFFLRVPLLPRVQPGESKNRKGDEDEECGNVRGAILSLLSLFSF